MQPDDPLHLALLLSRQRKRRGMSYMRLATESGCQYRCTVRAVKTGRMHSITLLRLFSTLGLELPSLPPPLGQPRL